MRTKSTITITTEVELSIEVAAKWFSGLDDDAQAKFFVEVAKVAHDTFTAHPESQWIQIGSHLKNCECSTNDAREMIRSIAYGLDHGTH